jgi:hypothetical protein
MAAWAKPSPILFRRKSEPDFLQITSLPADQMSNRVNAVA